MSDERADDSPDEPGKRLGDLAELLAIGQDSPPNPDRLVRLAAAAVPGCDYACLTQTVGDEQLDTLACSDERAAALAGAQLELGEGPVLDAIERSDMIDVADFAVDLRWPRFAARAVAAGVHSCVSVRMRLENHRRAALTFYATGPNAFGDLDVEIAALFGSYVAMALQRARDRAHAANLELALESNRSIGTAIGIVMARELVTAEQAFDRLRAVSQHAHRKLRDVADEVIRTGQLPAVE